MSRQLVKRGDVDEAIAILRDDIEKGHDVSRELIDVLVGDNRTDLLVEEVRAGTEGALDAWLRMTASVTGD